MIAIADGGKLVLNDREPLLELVQIDRFQLGGCVAHGGFIWGLTFKCADAIAVGYHSFVIYFPSSVVTKTLD